MHLRGQIWSDPRQLDSVECGTLPHGRENDMRGNPGPVSQTSSFLQFARTLCLIIHHRPALSFMWVAQACWSGVACGAAPRQRQERAGILVLLTRRSRVQEYRRGYSHGNLIPNIFGGPLFVGASVNCHKDIERMPTHRVGSRTLPSLCPLPIMVLITPR